jgi:hypothetical protein
LVGVAVKVADAIAHTGLDEAAIATLAGRYVLTVMLIAFDVAGLPVTHVALEVMTQVTWSPLFGVYE